MIEAFWIPLLPPYLIGLVLSFAVEALLTPRPVAPWRRPLAAVGVHVGVWTLAFALELMLFRRPYFAVANVLAIELLIVLVSNAKYQALREPFVYPDFEYFLDAVKHPRLYLPFFGVVPALVAGGGYGLALWAGLALEDAITVEIGLWLATASAAPDAGILESANPFNGVLSYSIIIALGGVAIIKIGVCRLKVSLDATEDLKRLGLLAACCSYRYLEKMPIDQIRDGAPFAPQKNVVRMDLESRGQRPDFVVIQSESFFDVREVYPCVQKGILRNFDRLRYEGNQYGALEVSAWGANTVRTEFSFLSGMTDATLGVHRYNPYRRLALRGFPTIASYLQQQGYRTICVHPHHRTFYRRSVVLPRIGFDEFIGIEAFELTDRDGAYIGDRAVGKKVQELLSIPTGRPLYIHVITMENHGPLHLEKVSADDVRGVLMSDIPAGCEDLVAYGRHLQNADEMLGALANHLEARTRPTLLCFFGDHVPIMPKVYKKLGAPAGTTNYFMWHSHQKNTALQRTLHVSELAKTYLNTASVKI